LLGYQAAQCGFRWNVLNLFVFRQATWYDLDRVVQFLSHDHRALTILVVFLTGKGNCNCTKSVPATNGPIQLHTKWTMTLYYVTNQSIISCYNPRHVSDLVRAWKRVPEPSCCPPGKVGDGRRLISKLLPWTTLHHGKSWKLVPTVIISWLMEVMGTSGTCKEGEPPPTQRWRQALCAHQGTKRHQGRPDSLREEAS